MGITELNATSTAMAEVDLALVLAVDCSSSVDSGDYYLQMHGIAAALRNPPLFEAIAEGPNQRVAILLVHWSNRNGQMIAIPWRILGHKIEIETVAREVERAPRQWLPGGTGMAAAIYFCTGQLNNLPFNATRLVIDVSGDGEENEGGDVEAARLNATNLGVTINGLPIIDGSLLVEAYYQQRVIAGPGAFIVPAVNIHAFKTAMTQKLLREIQVRNS